MKKLIKYSILFFSTLILLFFALVVSVKIPRSAIVDNLKESVEYYKHHQGIYIIDSKRLYTYIHYFADVRKLNIIYCIDSEKPIESVLWSKYYQTIKKDTNIDFIDLINNSEEPNTQYLRYWNGCMLFLRPMLTVFNMEQIYLINQVLLSILVIVLLVMLFKKSKKLAFIFLSALILVASWYVGFCIEYSVMFYVMIITSMIALKIDSNKKNETNNKIDEKLLKLFFITGIVTPFFDFLTTEILTIFVPLIFILVIRKEENRLGSLKDVFKFVIKSCALWLIGYVGMWFSKWILASALLHINAFEYVKDEFLQRVNGLQGLSQYSILYNGVIPRNLFTIPLLDIIRENINKLEVKIAIVITVALIVIFANWKEIKNKKYLIIFVLIGITPYIRYLILANHSYRHVMFTFRDQIITIMAYIYIITECLNYKLLFKKMSIKDSFKNIRKNKYKNN